MNEVSFRNKPSLHWRIVLLGFLILFAYVDNNPLVKLVAQLGLSPSPIEKYIGVKSLFSGMTEGVHQIANLNFDAAIKANCFSPLVIPLVAYYLLTWRIPRVQNKKDEVLFFSGFISLSVIVNVVN